MADFQPVIGHRFDFRVTPMPHWSRVVSATTDDTAKIFYNVACANWKVRQKEFGLVAVKNAEADRFIARPQQAVFLYLVFGSDAGLVSERAKKIVARAIDDPKDPFQLLRLGGDELAADPLRLADEANTVPLFGGRRAIWIEAQGKAFLLALEPVLHAPPSDCTIVIEAGALKRDATLRKICESAPRAAAIECYPDSARDLAQLIDSEAAAAGLRVDDEARAYLISLLGQDRLATRAEIEKLLLYARGDGRVTITHIDAIVADASMLALDAAVNGAFEGNLGAVHETTARVYAEGGDYNMILGVALRHAILLHRMRLDIEAGRGSGGSGQGYGRAAVLDKHVRAWTSPRLARAIAILNEAVARSRREPKIAEAITTRALWTIALAARSTRDAASA
jgi:DNA polymerase III subunit delta